VEAMTGQKPYTTHEVDALATKLVATAADNPNGLVKILALAQVLGAYISFAPENIRDQVLDMAMERLTKTIEVSIETGLAGTGKHVQ
jgi:hypothetical protein